MNLKLKNNKYLKSALLVVFVSIVAVGGILLRSTTVSEDNAVDTLQFQSYAFTSIYGTYSAGTFDQHDTEEAEPINLYDTYLESVRSLMTAEGYDKVAEDGEARKLVLAETNLAFSTLPEGAEKDVIIEVAEDKKSARAYVQAIKTAYDKTTDGSIETNVEYRISYVLVDKTWFVSNVEVSEETAI